jgi:hypothetical protein
VKEKESENRGEGKRMASSSGEWFLAIFPFLYVHRRNLENSGRIPAEFHRNSGGIPAKSAGTLPDSLQIPARLKYSGTGMWCAGIPAKQVKSTVPFFQPKAFRQPTYSGKVCRNAPDSDFLPSHHASNQNSGSWNGKPRSPPPPHLTTIAVATG